MMSESADDRRAEEAEEAILREGSRVAIKSVAVWGVLAAAAVFGAVFAARSTLEASQELFKGGGKDWYEASMPAVLFALIGAGLGCLLGWRIVAASGLTGHAAWRIGAVGWSLVEGVAIIAAIMAFGGHIPIVFWIAWAVMSITGILGITVFTVWTA